jgi:hypothetical protein
MTRIRAAALAGAFLCIRETRAVLRYPDIDWELRDKSLSVEECISKKRKEGTAAVKRCLNQLRYQLLEDADCTAVVPSFDLHLPHPLEQWQVNTTCDGATTLFKRLWDLGMRSLLRGDMVSDWRRVEEAFYWFDANQTLPLSYPPEQDFRIVYIANSTVSVCARHTEEILRHWRETMYGSPTQLLKLAHRVSLQIQYMIENLAVAVMTNYASFQLQREVSLWNKNMTWSPRHDELKERFVFENYGKGMHITWHDIGTKRWDVLRYLLGYLTHTNEAIGQPHPLQVVEIGVESANTSVRLFTADGSPEHHHHNGSDLKLHVGVDPYINRPACWEKASRRLHQFEGRSMLLRSTSDHAADLIADKSMDLVFLDARHDPGSVMLDIHWWHPKVKPGGILAGHDFSWLYPGVGMAVCQMTRKVWLTHPVQVNVAMDGVWWWHVPFE